MINAFKFHLDNDWAEDVFCAHIRGDLRDKNDLLNALYYQLWLPCYFGFNWDALQECLTDLSWIKKGKIIIIHEAMPNLTENDTKIYLDILVDSIASTKKYGDHTMEIIFPERDKDRILSLISQKI